MKIGVFDSGLGGEAVAEELRRLLPNAQVISINDRVHMPYGTKPRAEIMKLTQAAIQPLLQLECDTIVIACNTATTAAIQLLRHDYPTQKFIGLEPMVKPASLLSETGVVATLATPATIASPRYQQLKDDYAKDIKVIEPNCSSWAELIETNQREAINLEDTIKPLLEQNVDVIILGCTHYHWLKQDIEKIVGPTVTVLEPSDAIKNRILEITS